MFSDCLINQALEESKNIINEIVNNSDSLQNFLFKVPVINEFEMPNTPAVYCLTSTKGRQKSYIGESLDPYVRMSHYRNPNNNKYQVVVQAIAKHGWTNFNKRVLYKFSYLTTEILSKLSSDDKQKISQILRSIEKALIIKYNLRDKNIGYNIVVGGRDRTGCKASDQTRKNISRATSGVNNPNYGKQHSLKTKRKISISNIGRKRTKETKDKISKANKGKTLSDETKRKIRDANIGKIRSKESIAKRIAIIKKPINQIDLKTGNIIKQWASATDAVKFIFGKFKNPTAIIHVCKNRQKTAYGFYWQYANEV